MPNLSRFVARLKKINGNESLQNISAPQYIFILNLTLRTGYNHNINWCKRPEIKTQAKKGPKKA